MSDYSEYGGVTPLDGFDVVAVDGEGVYIAREDGSSWRVATVDMLEAQGGSLLRAYERAVADE
jgi:hypothetical protein